MQALGCRTTYHNFDVVNNSEIVILAVKPPVFPSILDEIRSSVTAKHLLISIALGIKISSIESVGSFCESCVVLFDTNMQFVR